ncbi:glycosyltransferase family 1 protein [Actimicrobium sp. CCC2.4]|uniref:glycosyltransferase family 1 protein n=1 Tax=Actimicrobium sp. CCC2.4 TaxID=3048606 RepID=UPI002AC95972|nr:glycosyltransferase family 1 protein [Actimicrobium sp. CCC2.4]MEB0136051.1 glycosyltransferase family 1 protein [Actimicrobium sp. CCC2.4]WPX32191.1 glycosyltransferase family 1 protein [Actimicrobium sp. CCC2.4]
MSHDKLLSRSISARFGPLLAYLKNNEMITWEQIVEDDITINHLKNFDAVLFNKHTSSRAIEIMRLANNIGLTTIYDLDDWIIDLPTYSVTNLNDDLLANIIWFLRSSKFITVSNKVLKEKLHRIRPSSIIIENGFDSNVAKKISIGWEESSPSKILFSNTDGIKLINFRKDFFKAVIDFMNRHSEVVLEFWGDEFPEMSIIPRLKPMGFLGNVEYKLALRQAGYIFGIVPLGGREDNESLFFNSCKSCIKYIDYGSLGIPGIYSKSPVYENVISHLDTGFLASNNYDDWTIAMEELYSNDKLRQTMRENAFNDTLNRFGLAQSAQVFHKILTSSFIE